LFGIACVYPPSDASEDTDTDAGPTLDGGTTGGPGDDGDDGDGGDSSGGTPTDPPPADCDELEATVLDILQTNCAGCHGPGSVGKGDFDYVLDIEKLIASGKIVKGDPAASPLFKKVSSGEMPPASATQRPSDEDKWALEDFILSCTDDAPPPTECQGTNQFISNDEMFQAMFADINSLPDRDREFARYFTLVHLHNQGVCDKELDVFRDGLVKIVNSLSTETLAVAPESIDGKNLIYRIDLRDYNWEETNDFGQDKWELVANQSPYRILFFEDDFRTLQLFAGTEFPFQRVDHFLFEASQEDTYYEFLDIPDNLSVLEQDLAVDINDNIIDEEVWRAGFVESGVSEQNRVIERHLLGTGGNRIMWISYDFADDNGGANVLANPLDFEEAGSEVIFTLPNGFHGYMIVDAFGDRLDVAPDFIVTDPAQKDHNVRAGISCMSCHSTGINLKEDEVRNYVLNSTEFDFEEKEIVEAIYPDPSEMTALMEGDAQAYADALSRVGLTPKQNEEPAIRVFQGYEANVSLEAAAAELGLTPEQLQKDLSKLDPQLAPLEWTQIKREVFEDLFAESVCLLNIGIADDSECD
jgi:serine/threonine-protein kinase